MEDELFYVEDISNGVESKPVKAINEYNFDKLPPFKYSKTVQVDGELKELFEKNEGCVCVSGCGASCTCVSAGELAIAANPEDSKYWKLCTQGTCSCSSANCDNRALDSNKETVEEDLIPLKIPVCVYYVHPKVGFGLRSIGRIPSNTTVFEYAGELTKHKEDVEEGADDYIYKLRYKGFELMLDANSVGNVARFVNHSCDPNLRTEYQMFGSSTLPHLAFVSLREIQAGEQLTVYYESQWWDAKDGDVRCMCESKICEFSGKDKEKKKGKIMNGHAESQ